MIYFVIFSFLFYFMLKYDYRFIHSTNTEKLSSVIDTTSLSIKPIIFSFPKKIFKLDIIYSLVFFLFVFLSGFSFRVGSDIGKYMYDFNNLHWNDLDLTNISLSSRQPFWLLLQLLCKSIVNNFIFFKIIVSFIVYFAIFLFIRKSTNYLFSSLLLYYVIMSFDINFNILRQSLAICFFLLACLQLNNKKIFKSYLLILSAIMFHNSAFVLLFIPILSLLKVKDNFKISIFVLWLFSILILLLPTAKILLFLLQLISDDTITNLSKIYLLSDYGSYSFSFVKVLFYLIIFSFIAFLYYKSGASNLNMILFYCYIICFISSYVIPIIGRITFYFSIFYIIALCESLYFFAKNILAANSKRLFVTVALLIVVLCSIRFYFIVNPRLGTYNYVQFYPYYSVFNPIIVEERDYPIVY